MKQVKGEIAFRLLINQLNVKKQISWGKLDV